MPQKGKRRLAPPSYTPSYACYASATSQAAMEQVHTFPEFSYVSRSNTACAPLFRGAQLTHLLESEEHLASPRFASARSATPSRIIHCTHAGAPCATSADCTISARDVRRGSPSIWPFPSLPPEPLGLRACAHPPPGSLPPCPPPHGHTRSPGVQTLFRCPG